ncbi:hypothetical protein GGI21_003486, partial [Coemansia aciculifera]
MPPSFEDELNDYVNSSQLKFDAPAPDSTQEKGLDGAQLQLPEGFEISADPQYAYNESNGLWLDTLTGAVSYYDSLTLTYIPVQVEEQKEPDRFEGVVRLVVIESDCFTSGQ